VLEDEKRNILLGHSIKAQLRYLQKCISPFPGFVFSWKKILSEKQMLVKQNVLEYSYGLTFLLNFVFSVDPSIPETIEI
jgi:hypothetical protein